MIMRSLSRRLAALVAAAALALSAAACGSSGSTSASGGPGGTAAATGTFPPSITTAIGVVHVRSRPTVIVSLSPTATEMLYAIGAGSQVKAVDSYSNYPPNAPITKLSAYTPSVEAIAKYKPDLVVVATDSASFNSQMAALK